MLETELSPDYGIDKRYALLFDGISRKRLTSSNECVAVNNLPDPVYVLPAKLLCLFEPHRYKMVYGGRGGAKSWGFSRSLLIHGARRRLRILCVREYQSSIKDSVHEVLTRQIDLLGLSNLYDILDTEIRGKNGTEFIFAGLRTHPNKIKSLEGVNICWIEQAEQIDKASWDALEPTIRDPDLAEIWMSMNPDSETDPLYATFVTPTLPGGDPSKLPPGSLVVPISWRDNPWLPEVLRQSMLHKMATDPDGYDHIWEGQPKKHSKARVLHGKYVSYSFDPAPDWNGPYQGLDFGFSTTPAAGVRCWVHDDRLWIERECFGLNLEIDTSENGLLKRLEKDIPDFARHRTYADNARPESISYMQRHGFSKVEACQKWKGCNEDGIAHLRSYKEIVIHPRCENTLDQAKLWSYKVDRLTGDILPDLVDANDDTWQATMYAIGKLIKPVKSFFGDVLRR